MILAVLLVGCGDSSEPRPADAGPQPTQSAEQPYELTCRDLRKPEARTDAIEFVADVLVAPKGQGRAQTIGIVRRSLEETCGLPTLPNVDDPADYRPVKPVRQAVQRHFDQDAIYDR